MGCLLEFCLFCGMRLFAGDLMEGGKPPRDCKQSLRPTMNFNVFVGAIHESPVFTHDNRLFSGCRGRHPLQVIFRFGLVVFDCTKIQII